MINEIDIRTAKDDESIGVIRFSDKVQSNANVVCKSTRSSKEILIADGTGTRLFIHSKDVDNLIKALEESKRLGWI